MRKGERKRDPDLENVFAWKGANVVDGTGYKLAFVCELQGREGSFVSVYPSAIWPPPYPPHENPAAAKAHVSKLLTNLGMTEVEGFDKKIETPISTL